MTRIWERELGEVADLTGLHNFPNPYLLLLTTHSASISISIAPDLCIQQTTRTRKIIISRKERKKKKKIRKTKRKNRKAS